MRPKPSFLLAIALLCLSPASRLAAEEVPDSVTGVDLRKEHLARRDALGRALPADGIAICMAVRADVMDTFSQRQDEDYRWLTGITEPNGILVVHAGTDRSRDLLLLPPRNARLESWIGPRLYPGKDAEAATGVSRTEDARQATEVLAREIRGRRRVYLPSRGEASEIARRLLGDVLENSPGKPEVESLGSLTGPLRWKKSEEEIARIRRSAELAAVGHRRCMQATRAGMVEYELQAILEKACREGGARRQAYDSIVASGPNNSVLHYSANRRILESGELVLMDAGGEYMGYACDVTRTWPVDAQFSAEQARVYDVVLRAQEAGMAAAVKGATFKDISAACMKVVVEAKLREGWQHGPCHWVGMGVHDPNGSLPLEPGCVFVIEPGLYFPEQGFGIRIEDTFVMKKDGTLECLSAAVPKERGAIEALRAEALSRAATDER